VPSVTRQLIALETIVENEYLRAITQEQVAYLLNTRRNAVVTGLMNVRENAGAKYMDVPIRSGSRASK